jgi:glyoxylase-like metal-dependent hydrolase (beta-lactamase superfamily II)
MTLPQISNRTKFIFIFTLLAVAALSLTVCTWPISRHGAVPARLGTVSSASALEAVMDAPGPITVETVVGATWQVDRSGLINLKHPKARAAGLVDGPEPIEIFFHALRHPTRGLFLVDSGVEDALLNDPAHAALHGMLADAAHVDRLKIQITTAAWLKAHAETPQGVFLTHLHLDHVLGLPDVPSQVPIYAGPGEMAERGGLDILMQPVIDRALGAHGPLQTLPFVADPNAAFVGVLDVFGDGTLWALWVPGHTRGSVAFVVRTPKGPVLLTGDACHTAWGWKNGVEPGTFSEDIAASAQSLAELRALSARHPQLDVRLGHQTLAGSAG